MVSVMGPFEAFDGRDFLPANVGKNLRHTGLYTAKSAGGELFIYAEGVYVPGESWIRSLIPDQLEEDWSPWRADAVIRYLKDTSDELEERPKGDYLNLRNGLLEIATGKLRPHRPEYRTTVQLPARYVPDVVPDAFLAFIEQVSSDDDADFIGQVLGYLLTPDLDQQAAFLFVGDGRNGKSVLLSVIERLLGRENVAHVSLHDLERDRFALAGLEGKLANIVPDIAGTTLSKTDIFKRLTGQDAVRMERKYEQAYSAYPFARHIFAANEIPQSADSSEGFMRRWKVLRLPHHFDRKVCPCGQVHDVEPYDALLARLTTDQELSGILNLALMGRASLRQNGWIETEGTRFGEQEFRSAVDPIALFLEECCELGAGLSAERGGLYQTYRLWAEQAGLHSLANKSFYDRLRESFTPVRLGDHRGFAGLALRSTASVRRIAS